MVPTDCSSSSLAILQGVGVPSFQFCLFTLGFTVVARIVQVARRISVLIRRINICLLIAIVKVSFGGQGRFGVCFLLAFCYSSSSMLCTLNRTPCSRSCLTQIDPKLTAYARMMREVQPQGFAKTTQTVVQWLLSSLSSCAAERFNALSHVTSQNPYQTLLESQ